MAKLRKGVHVPFDIMARVKYACNVMHDAHKHTKVHRPFLLLKVLDAMRVFQLRPALYPFTPLLFVRFFSVYVLYRIFLFCVGIHA